MLIQFRSFRSIDFRNTFEGVELELELIQTRMTQKRLLWAEVGKSACVLVGICGLRLSPPARYGPLFPPTFGLSLRVSGPRPINLLVYAN